jgi:SAM-dependent methyltransferase
MGESSSYPLGYTEGEACRLTSQAAFLEDLTEDVLRRAGIGSGMHVLDLGCGVGDVSLLAARLVGEAGSVLGIDRSAPSVETARRRAMTLGVRTAQFETAELDTFESAQTFDAVIGRLVLLYQPDPVATLRRFRKFLIPNGVIAFQEVNIEDAMQLPSSETFERVRSWFLSAFRACGAEPNMGNKLLPTFLGAGLPRPTMIMTVRVESGPNSYTYAHLAGVIRSMLPLLERAGLATAEEVAIDTLADRLRQEATKNECATFSPHLVGAWSRLPKS